MSEVVRFKRYLHRNKEDNFDIADFFGDDVLRYCGYEVELIYEYNKSTRELKLVGAGGFFLSDEEITPGECIEIPEQL